MYSRRPCSSLHCSTIHSQSRSRLRIASTTSFAAFREVTSPARSLARYVSSTIATFTVTRIDGVTVSKEQPLSFVRLFTDGACKGNPGPGGWACILRHPASGKERELSGGVKSTTNNQMELQAVIEGLSALSRRSSVEVVTDSKYVADGCTQWMANWKRNGWKRREKSSLKPV